MDSREQVPLARLTTFRLGGPARFFICAQTVQDVRDALAFARERGYKTCILGGGSNVLVADAGFDGVVIRIELRGIDKDGDMLIAAAGERWDGLVARAVREGLWGLENLSGIPGTVGAAPVQNIGAYGAELTDTLAWLEALDTYSGIVTRFANSDCGFGYRTSRFKREPGRYVVLRAAFQLKKNGAPNDSYKDLADIARVHLSLDAIRRKVLAVRSQKFPDLSAEGTAGSFFLNPIVSTAVAARLAARYPGMPQFPGAGGVKLSLAWLLDHALGLTGAQCGGARLFERQPLVVVASPGATASDVTALSQKIKKEVHDKLGIEIEEEVRSI